MFQSGISWPFAVIDFEASALDEQSYPIEVGVALWDGPIAPVRTWSSLIEPAPPWVRDGVWFEAAQRIHGISPTDLVGAPRPATVLTALNAMLRNAQTAISDNPKWEDQWLRRLADAAGGEPRFTVDGLSDRLAYLPGHVRQLMIEHVGANPRPHRAGADALLLVQALAHGLGRDPDIVPWTPEP